MPILIRPDSSLADAHRKIFSFQRFNAVQSAVFHSVRGFQPMRLQSRLHANAFVIEQVYETNDNLVVSCKKTSILEHESMSDIVRANDARLFSSSNRFRQDRHLRIGYTQDAQIYAYTRRRHRNKAFSSILGPDKGRKFESSPSYRTPADTGSGTML